MTYRLSVRPASFPVETMTTIVLTGAIYVMIPSVKRWLQALKKKNQTEVHGISQDFFTNLE